MTLEYLQNYFVGQRFTIKYDSVGGATEVFELHIKHIGEKYIDCYYRYLESNDNTKKTGNLKYERWLIDDMIKDAWNGKDSWVLIGFYPIKPLNDLPEELFRI